MMMRAAAGVSRTGSFMSLGVILSVLSFLVALTHSLGMASIRATIIQPHMRRALASSDPEHRLVAIKRTQNHRRHLSLQEAFVLKQHEEEDLEQKEQKLTEESLFDSDWYISI